MQALNYDPLDYYNKKIKNEHADSAIAYFDRLTSESGVDVPENQRTVKKYDAECAAAEKQGKRAALYKALRVLAYIIAIGAAIAFIYGLFEDYVVSLVAFPISLCAFLLIFLKLNKVIKNIMDIIAKHRALADKYLKEAQAQMAPLNALFDDEDTFRLLKKTLPDLEFKRHLTQEQEDDMMLNFDLPPYYNADVSVTDTLAGSFKSNPFFFERRLIRKMGTETYHGYKVITWQQRYRDSKGNIRTRTVSQTLHAQVTKPKPFYYTDTVLNYGAAGAPDLSFSRDNRHIEAKSDGAIDRMVKKGERKLKKKQEKALKGGGTFTAMTNAEFDVLFDATNRDHETQFRVMFSPLAQQNMVELLLSDDTYGDDFDFVKRKKHNVIHSDHSQSWNMDTSARNYISYSYDIARNNFLTFNNNYLKSVYFDFAPLFAIPVYQEELDVERNKPPKPHNKYSDRECEVLANAIGRRSFAHPATRTDVILKARTVSSTDKYDTVRISANSYTTEDRIDFIPVLGGDGCMHAVPVPWKEYIPVEASSEMAITYLGLSEREYTGGSPIAKDALSMAGGRLHSYKNKLFAFKK